jgi:hypothetical protein
VEQAALGECRYHQQLVHHGCRDGQLLVHPGGDSDETKVEYTFDYIRGNDGGLKIVVHQSSVPYNGA